ncbi:MAG TPA: exodeoxyribonuclease VII small subunit [Candidatus Paceibacterota bacterium]
MTQIQNPKKQNLQQALERLESLVKELEAKDVDVEAGLAKFKEGVDLVKFCQGQLQEAENEFRKLKTELEEEDSME